MKLNMEEVGELLNASYQQIASWNKLGYLGVEKKSREFSYSELEEFVNNYVTMAQLIAGLKTSNIKIMDTLLKKGILPVSGPIVNGGTGYI